MSRPFFDSPLPFIMVVLVGIIVGAPCAVAFIINEPELTPAAKFECVDTCLDHRSMFIDDVCHCKVDNGWAEAGVFAETHGEECSG